MRIVAISDSHAQHRAIKLPKEGDILIHSGDISYEGEINILSDFVKWLCEQTQFRHKIFISGNHELTLEANPSLIKTLFETPMAQECSVHYLHDSEIVLDNIKYYGSPYSSWFYDWAFNFPRWDAQNGYQAAKAKWNKIPVDTDILITHAPPRGIMDLVDRNENVGCPILRDRIFNDLKQLKLHTFGHIHRNLKDHKIEKHGEITFVNAASCNEKYRPIQPPVVVDLK